MKGAHACATRNIASSTIYTSRDAHNLGAIGTAILQSHVFKTGTNTCKLIALALIFVCAVSRARLYCSDTRVTDPSTITYAFSRSSVARSMTTKRYVVRGACLVRAIRTPITKITRACTNKNITFTVSRAIHWARYKSSAA